MPEVEDLAFKIIAAFEDEYFLPAKRNAFNAVFNKYLPLVDPQGSMDPYDASVELGYSHRAEFNEMIKELKEQSLIS